jgi:hypothetical protein
LFSCTPTLFAFAQKFNFKCSNCIYVLNYRLCKLYLHIIHLPFYTFQRWWMQWWPYSQQLNIQHSFFYSSQLFFNFYSFQQFCFLLLPFFVLAPLCFLSLYYSLQFFKCTFYTHTAVNSKTSKMHTTSNNKRKLLSKVIPFFFILEHLARHILLIHFFIYSLFVINAWSLKLIWPITISLCVPYTTTSKHLAS